MSSSLPEQIQRLKRLEEQPLLSYNDSYQISEAMRELLVDDYSIEVLIQDFGGSHSLAVASACCVTVTSLLKRERSLLAFQYLSLLASKVIFRFDYNIVTAVLSAACYCSAVIEEVKELDREAIILLCGLGLDFAEAQVPGGNANTARAYEVVGSVEILAEVLYDNWHIEGDALGLSAKLKRIRLILDKS